VYKRCLPGAKVRVQGSCVYQGVAAPLVTVGPAGQRRQTERSILRPTTVIVFPATTAWFALRKLRPTNEIETHICRHSRQSANAPGFVREAVDLDCEQ
jgi:hypothetical protein